MRASAKLLFFLLLSVLSWAVFPGHTWLQQDTQIYAPILEHIRDPSLLRQDLIVQHPHVALTLYDETALTLRWLTGLDFHTVLMALDILLRAAGFGGVFLIATALGLDAEAAAIVTLLWSLGATITGPAVMTVEYEPVPRGFALPLVMLAIGLASHARWRAAGMAASVAVLFHAPTTWPFWLVAPAFRKRRLWPPLLAACALLLAAAHFQSGPGESGGIFATLPPALEQLQRLRASYNWISMWPGEAILQHCFLFAVAMLALWRLGPRVPPALRLFALSLPVIGLASMPLSWLLLERCKWALMPQLQPMRAVLFITAFAVLLSAAAGCVAARARRFPEAFAWFLLPWLLPMRSRLLAVPPTPQMLLCLAFAVLTVAALAWPKSRASLALLACYFAIPAFARINGTATLHTPEIAALSSWARHSTPADAVFFFADNGKANYPGIFRAEALRAVYVDWKGGGQVNYKPVFAAEWWRRWQQTTGAGPAQTERYRTMGIGYLVVSPAHYLPGRDPVYRNAKYLVYPLK